MGYMHVIRSDADVKRAELGGSQQSEEAKGGEQPPNQDILHHTQCEGPHRFV